MKPLLFDVFLYNGDEVCQYRLDYLYNYVDYFVLIEAGETFTGKPKPYYIDKAIPHFWKYADKLITIKVDKLPPRPDTFTLSSNNNPDDWWRELSQREQCKSVISSVANNNEFIVISGDVDEIPNRNILMDREKLYISTFLPLYLNMDFFYYNFRWKKSVKWDQCYIINDTSFFKKPLSEYKIFKQGPSINNGWHLSYFMSRENIIRKIESIGHTEFNNDKFKTEEHLYKCLNTGIDLFNREGENMYDVFAAGEQNTLPAGWSKLQRIMEDIQ